MPRPAATPFPDSADFKGRLTECSRKLGSVNALAKESGIPQSTIRNYFEDGEPSRYNLVAIAKAAKVSIGWLAAGKIEGADTEGSLQQEPWQEIEFQSRFNALLARHGGAEELSRRSGVPEHRLYHVKAGGDLNRSEWRALSVATKTSIGWLMGAEDDISKEIIPAFSGLTEYAKKVHVSVAAEFKQLLQDAPWPSNLSAAPINRANVVNEVLKRIPESGLIPFTMPDDSMSPTLTKGDLLIFKSTDWPKQQGIYLIEDKSAESFSVCRLASQGSQISGSRDHPEFKSIGPFIFEPSVFKCHGRLISRLVDI